MTAVAGMAALASFAAVPLAGATAGTAVAAPATHLATGRAVPATYNGKPLFVQTSGPKAGTFGCQAPGANPGCLGPAQVRRAYDIPSNLTGRGETIAIVDAFGDPFIASDLALFDSTFGLPGANLNIICVGGTCPTFNVNSADERSWAGEIALDTQWAHADAPGATIDLVIAKSDQDADIFAAQQYVISHNLGDVLSQSFGEGEVCQSSSIFAATHQLFVQAQAEHMSAFASSGDTGSSQPACNGNGFFKSVGTPASDPLVTAVGGTHLNANLTTGAYQGESVWNDSGTNIDLGATGGGFSTEYLRPSYQAFANGNRWRGVPDVAWDADVFNGVLGACSGCGAGPNRFFIFAGTSSGSPQWAAITALADQAAGHRLGFLNPTLYDIAVAVTNYNFAFHDVLTGNNVWDGDGNIPGYSAGPGWDPTTGLGSPDVAHLINLLSQGRG
ncbi:MAG TPA: S53 family peptidase [Gemmataceae bacterium]|nr:S53 family peptidase [Gemmataceae bacterium]